MPKNNNLSHRIVPSDAIFVRLGSLLTAIVAATCLVACGGGGSSSASGSVGSTPAGSSTAGSVTTAPNSQPALQIDTSSYQLVSSVRTGRTTYVYTYRVNVVNRGGAATNVNASVTSGVTSTVIVDGNVSFGPVPAGATVTSTDTFSFSQDRQVAFDPSTLNWTVTNTSGSAVVQLSTDQQSISEGDAFILTITLPAAAATDTTVQLSSSDASTISVPPEAIVYAGQTQASAAIDGLSPGNAVITVSAATLPAATLPVTVLQRDFFLIGRAEAVNVGSSLTETVHLVKPAPTSGYTIALTAGNIALATVDSASISIPAGASTGTFSISGVAVGDTKIQLSGQGQAVGQDTLQVRVTAAAANNDYSSDELIQHAADAGQITSEQALLYRVYATFGDSQLPDQFMGRADLNFDSPIRVDVPLQWSSLSSATQQAIAPYFLPPIYAGSWGDASTATAERTRVQKTTTTRFALPTKCELVLGSQAAPQPDWGYLDTKHFRIWYRNVQAPFSSDTPVMSQHTAVILSAIVEQVYDAETVLMQRVPLSDGAQNCNGGDDHIDIYAYAKNALWAETVPYLENGCAQVPGFIVMDPWHAQDPKDARNIFAHEFMHLLQFAYAKGGTCADYHWMDEATANWAMQFVYAPDHYVYRFSKDYYSLYSVWMDFSIPVDLYLSSAPGHWCALGYCKFPLFYYLTQTYGNQRMSDIYSASEFLDPIAAIDFGLGSNTSLTKAWQDFSLASLNDFTDGVSDDFYKWDGDPAGIYTGELVPKTDPNDVIVASLGSQSDRDLTADIYQGFLNNFNAAAGVPGNAPLFRLSMHALDIRFSDPSVSFISYENIAPLQGNPNIKLWAIEKLNGVWQTPADWTSKESATFCRDKKDEQLSELILIYSNGDSQSRGSKTSSSFFELNPGDINDPDHAFTPKVHLSNAGCYEWTGSTSVTSSVPNRGFAAGQFGNASDSATAVTFMILPVAGETGDTQFFQSVSGTATTYSLTGLESPAGDGACTTTEGPGTGPIGVGDDQLFVTLYAADPTQRTVVNWLGPTTLIPNVPVVYACGTSTTFTSPLYSTWISLPDTAIVSADGRSITGSVMATDPTTGDTSTVTWDLHALKQ